MLLETFDSSKAEWLPIDSCQL